MWLQTGADGCICYLEYDKNLQIIKFVGMKQVKELSLIESISVDNKYSDDNGSSNYAAGFASADFIIWNLATETKVPFSLYFQLPSFQHKQMSCFFLIQFSIAIGFANSMWWMEATTFLLPWQCS